MNYPVAVLKDTRYAVLLSSASIPVVPMTRVAPVGPKGDPGGNIMAIGLFEDAHLLTIPTGTDVVRTSGYAVPGLGIADYMEDLAVDAAYVAAYPRAAFISANSRGFRLTPNFNRIEITAVGGLGDALSSGTGTSNTAAFNAALAYGAAITTGVEIHFPAAKGHYRFATAPDELRFGVMLTAQGWHENPGLVNGVTKAFPQNYTGSVCRFDADVKGFTFSAFTDNLANAVAYEFESSNYSIIENLMVLSLGGTGTTSHGLDVYTTIRGRNVRVYGFAGNCLNINANTTGANRYGNADLSQFTACLFQAAKLHGVYLDGNDANVIKFDGCSFSNNGGCGSLDTTVVGNNLFVGCHYATNNQSFGTPTGWNAAQRAKVIADAPCLSDQFTGSAVQYRLKDYSGNDIGNESHYAACYDEGGAGSKARLRHPTTVIGGFLSETGTWHSEFTAQVVGRATRLSGEPGETRVQTPSGTSQFIIETLDSSYANLQLKSGGAAVLDILAIAGASYHSNDTFVFRNQAQSVTLATLSASSFIPGADNSRTLGNGGFRWSTVYAGTGTINTSDQRHKDDIDRPGDTLLDAWAEVDWQVFKYRDAIEAKGRDGARLHVGLVAQRVRKVLKKRGIDGFALGLLCYDEWDDQFEHDMGEEDVIEEVKVRDRAEPEGFRIERVTERRIVPRFDDEGKPVMRLARAAGNAFGVRYEEALALEAALQRRNVVRLEARLAALEQAVSASKPLGGRG